NETSRLVDRTARISGRLAGSSAGRTSAHLPPAVVGALVGRAFPFGLCFLRPELEVYLHRLLGAISMRQEARVTRRQFYGALLVGMAVLVAGNFAVERMTAHTVSRRLLADARGAGQAQIIALGNSLMRSGFVADHFAPPASPSAKSPAFNLAMGASTP